MFTQLTTPVPVHVIDKGSGLAFAVIDYGIEHNLIWVTALEWQVVTLTQANRPKMAGGH